MYEVENEKMKPWDLSCGLLTTDKSEVAVIYHLET